MKDYQYGFRHEKCDYVEYRYICAKSLESALRQAKAYVKECYGSDYKIVSIQEL